MEKIKDKETSKYNAIAEMAGLLRETTVKTLSYQTGVGVDEITPSSYVYGNSVFSKEEHETVKRAFLRLVSEI